MLEPIKATLAYAWNLINHLDTTTLWVVVVILILRAGPTKIWAGLQEDFVSIKGWLANSWTVLKGLFIKKS